MDKKIVFFGVLLLVLGFGLGAITGLKIYPKIKKQDTYQAGWDAAKKKLVDSGSPLAGNANMEIKSISGTVQKINGNKLTIKALVINPLADQNLETRIVTVDNNTKFYFSTPKDPQQFQKEMEEFAKKMQEQNRPQDLRAPYPDTRKEIQLSDLKEGQQISINTEENIADKKEFTAKEVIVRELQTQAGGAQNLPAAPIAAPAQNAPVAPNDLPAAPTQASVPAPVAPQNLPAPPAAK